ncbi:MAG: hypothetical protein IJ877_05535 [Candidatus Gastranaerophilales bacterium]|nr:hypothetical protein [Candidatus Gastranaerophilales bacterium]
MPLIYMVIQYGMMMFKAVQKKNYLYVNMLITKGMVKRRRLANAAIMNIVADKSFIRVVK